MGVHTALGCESGFAAAVNEREPDGVLPLGPGCDAVAGAQADVRDRSTPPALEAARPGWVERRLTHGAEPRVRAASGEDVGRLDAELREVPSRQRGFPVPLSPVAFTELHSALKNLVRNRARAKRLELLQAGQVAP